MGTSSSGSGRAPIHMFASAKSWIEGKSVGQLEQVAALPGVTAVAAMPDLHPGKYGPVGCAILADQLYPQLVGSDIGCGMGLFQLDIAARKLRLDRLAERMRSLDAPWDGDVAAAMVKAGIGETAFDASIGSIGGGNHFCELQAIDEILEPAAASKAGLVSGNTYLLVHSGSRGFGYSILEQHLANGVSALDPKSEAGQNYIAGHDHAVRWARLNRRIIAERAADAVRAGMAEIADLSHNLLEVRPNGDKPSVLHRKGAAPADRGLVPVPGSRGTLSYLVEPVADFPAEALASLAHGAGRKYDRASMHGRVNARKSGLARLERNPFGGIVICEESGLLVEEAPGAYKAIERVIADLVEFGLVRVVATFKPLLTFKTAGRKLEKNSGKQDRRGKRKARR